MCTKCMSELLEHSDTRGLGSSDPMVEKAYCVEAQACPLSLFSLQLRKYCPASEG